MKKTFTIVMFLFLFIIGIDHANAAAIGDGVYTIKSALDNNKVIDVYGGSTKNGTNIQLFKYNGSNAQKWKVKHLGGDYYTITSMLESSKVLDVRAAGKRNGTNVQLYSYNSRANAQKWKVKYAGDGYYYIVSKCNGLYVDVKGGKTANYTNIQMYKGNKKKAQKFKFVEVLTPSRTIDDGTYTITSILNSGKAIDLYAGNTANKTNVQLYSLNETWAQVWNVKYLNNGYYSITSYINSNKALDVYTGKPANGTNIQVYQNNGSNAQRWIIKDAGDGYYNIVSKIDNMYLDIKGGKTANGTNIQLFHGNGGNAQKFKFNKIEMKPLKDGLYTIDSFTNQNKSIGINTTLAINNSNVLLKDKTNNNNQKWYVKSIGKGFYKISSADNPNKVLDVKDGKSVIGTNIQLYAANNSDAQKWLIKYAGNGTYTMVSPKGFLYLNNTGTNIQLGKNKNDAQKFVFKGTSLNVSTSTKSYDDGYYTIVSSLDKSKALDVSGGRKTNGTNVQLYNSNSSTAQTWYLKYLNNGLYQITSSMNPETSLTLQSGSTNVQLYKYSGNNNQKWILKDAGDGYVYIISKQNGWFLDVAGAKAKNNANIYTKEGNLNKSQKFKLIEMTKQKIYTGIDISYHQEKNKPKIDWSKIGNSNLGFVIIRAGFGGDWTSQDDKSFKSFVAACEKYNIPYGLYLYSYAKDIENVDKTGAKDEAKHMLRLIKEIGASKYSPNLGTKVFLDVEDKSLTSTSKNKLTSVADYFCSTIEKSGYSCGIYANTTWFTKHINPSSLYPKYDIWIANYFDKAHPTFNDAMSRKPNYNLTPYKYWQFASDGRIAGISGNVDLDLGYNIFG